MLPAVTLQIRVHPAMLALRMKTPPAMILHISRVLPAVTLQIRVHPAMLALRMKTPSAMILHI